MVHTYPKLIEVLLLDHNKQQHFLIELLPEHDPKFLIPGQ